MAQEKEPYGVAAENVAAWIEHLSGKCAGQCQLPLPDLFYVDRGRVPDESRIAIYGLLCAKCAGALGLKRTAMKYSRERLAAELAGEPWPPFKPRKPLTEEQLAKNREYGRLWRAAKRAAKRV